MQGAGLLAECIGVAFACACIFAFCIEWSPRLVSRQRLFGFNEALICLSYSGENGLALVALPRCFAFTMIAVFVRTFAIGDIHGCHTALVRLLEEVQPQPADVVVFLGDYIDRGPGSREVVDTLLALNARCKPLFLRGNHEVMILDAWDNFEKAVFWQSFGGKQALQSYGADPKGDWQSQIPGSHWNFFQETLRFLETDETIFVHACLDPKLAMQDQPDDLLFWEDFSRIQPHDSGKTIICGHTPQRSKEIDNRGYAVCIDTGAAYGGWLTCLETTSGEYWQANEHGAIRSGRL
jgi:serine/threonine protein phosphatase 1